MDLRQDDAGMAHEYIVRGRVDVDLFALLVRHIRTNGYEGKFYQKSITYYDDGGLVYWTMGAPLEETLSSTDAGKRTHMRAAC